jgi:plastocyanin
VSLAVGRHGLAVSVSVGFALALAACGGKPSAPAPSPPPAAPPAAGTTVTILAGARGLGAGAYGANPLTVAAGTTVTWQNADSVPHTSTADGGAWSSGNIAAGGQFSVMLNAAGSYPYHCAIHASMTGRIVVQ